MEDLKMKIFNFLLIFFCAPICAQTLLSYDNIAQFCPQTPHIIPFMVTRDISNGALKLELLKNLQSIFSLRVFVETGTYLGSTVEQAVNIFENIYSIELSPFLARQAQSKFKKQKHITILCGDSSSIFRNLLPKIDSRILFYLDGHYSGGITAKGSMNTPILSELAAIRDSGISNAIILIDDIRGFQDSCYPEKIVNTCLEGYPDLYEVSNALVMINPQYQLCFLGDTLLAFPKESLVCVSPIVAACALHRFSHFNLGISDELLHYADKIIMSSQEIEKEQLIQYFNIYAPFEMELGFRCYGALWYGLVQQAEGNIERAYQILKQTSDSSLPKWHIESVLKKIIDKL